MVCSFGFLFFGCVEGSIIRVRKGLSAAYRLSTGLVVVCETGDVGFEGPKVAQLTALIRDFWV